MRTEEGKPTRPRKGNPVIPVEALALRFPNGRTLGYDVQGGCRNLLTRKLTVFTSDEGRTAAFSVNAKTGEARLGKMPTRKPFRGFPEDGDIFLLGGLPHRMLSAEEATLIVRNKVFRLKTPDAGENRKE